MQRAGLTAMNFLTWNLKKMTLLPKIFLLSYKEIFMEHRELAEQFSKPAQTVPTR